MVCAIRNTKKRGEWAELKFMARAAEMGLTVTKPWGESARYDVAVESNGRFLRVQVKSTEYRVGNSYICNVRPDSALRPYTTRQIDLLAAYVIPENVWYIIPAQVATRLKGNIWLSPRKRGHKYERYLEAWYLLRRKGADEKPSRQRRRPSSPGRKSREIPRCETEPRQGSRQNPARLKKGGAGL